MPDFDGLLSVDEREKAKKWISDHWTTKSGCPICASKKWTLGSHITYPMLYSSRALMGGAVAYPQVNCVCVTCGYTMEFNAVIVGLVETKKEPSPGAKNGD